MKIDIKPPNSKFNDEQWKAIHYRGENILVSASAGSGKTTVLIERIFNHIQSNYAKIDELLVVTFTEAAANEMKERMEIRLKDSVNHTRNPAEQQYLIEQINALSTAHIRTLHSFCLHVIQNFFYLIDFNPSFKLLTDETQTTLMYEEVWQNLVAEIYENRSSKDSYDPDSFFDLLSRYSEPRTDEGLSSLVIDLYKFSSSHPESQQWLESIAESSNFQEFIESDLYKQTIKKQLKNASMTTIKLLEKATNFLNTLSSETIEKYSEIIGNELNQVTEVYELLLENDFQQLLSRINSLQFNRWPSNSKKSDDYGLVKELKTLRDNAKKIVDDNIMTLFKYPYEDSKKIEDDLQKTLKDISHLTLMFSNKLKEFKEKKNVINYNDLEHLTLDILAPYDPVNKQRKASIAAAYYQDKFKEVMIDEYQDINEIQASILSYLSHERKEDSKGNLFMVGDVKQSIYGFRMAEPSLFLKKYRNYMEGQEGHLIILDKNYRSRDELLQFTNYLFERMMDEDFGEMNYSYKEALTTGNHSFIPKAPDPQFNIDLLLYEKESPEEEDVVLHDSIPYIDSSLEAESHIIAQDICRRVKNQEQIYDKDMQVERAVKYSDFVILSSTRKPFLIMQRVFENYQIPLFAQKIENYFQRQEVQLMIALLKIIDNPMQDIPLVAVLRSFFLGLTDEELSLVRINKRDGNYYEAVLTYTQEDNQNKDPELSTKLNSFLSQLAKWRELSNKISLVELIWTIYQETDYLDYVAGLSNGVQRQANLHALYERANEFEDSIYKGLFGFIRYIERVMEKENDLAEPLLLSPDSNYVRLMTVHASKGLEFPVLYIMNTGKKFNLTDARNKRYIASKNYGLGTDLYDYNQLLKFESIRKKAIKIEKENQLKAEEMRKLYVALTRCEQKLIIVGSINNQEKWEEYIQQIEDQAESDEILIPTHFRQAANTWLDWIGQSLAIQAKGVPSVASFNKEQITIRYINSEHIMRSEYQNSYQTKINTDKWLKEQFETIKSAHVFKESPLKQKIDKLLNYEYPYQLSVNTSSYQSVSELKRLYEEPRIERIDYYTDRRVIKPDLLEDKENQAIRGIRYTEDSFQHPKFKQKYDNRLTYREIGTATHYLLQRLDFSSFELLGTDKVREELIKQAKHLVLLNELSQELADSINYDNLEWFICSELGQELILNHQTLKREEAFSYLVPANELFNQTLNEDEKVELQDDQLLIHGVIDNYIEYQDSITLVDYKTDRYKTFSNKTRDQQIQIMKERYQFQLLLYGQALSTAKNKAIKQSKLVLLDFKEIIDLEL